MRMFCPKCGMYLSEGDLVRRNIKYAMGNVAVEYDARCPGCTEEIGHVSWGQFTLHPELNNTRFEAEPPPAEKESLIPPPPEIRTVLRRRKAEEPAVHIPPPPIPDIRLEEDEPPITRICPHCGRPWPEGE